MTSLQELIKTHNQELTKPYRNAPRPFSREDAFTFLEQAKTATNLYTAFFSLDAIVNRYDELYNDEEFKVELRKFEPILRLIKVINMKNKYTKDELNQFYDNCTEFFTNFKN
jgi:hypothetical protein